MYINYYSEALSEFPFIFSFFVSKKEIYIRYEKNIYNS